MRLRWKLLALCLCWAWAVQTAFAGDALSIEVAPGDWGNASPADIQRVLYSAAWSLQQFAPDRKLAPIRVVSGSGHPQVFYEKSARGEFIVRLTAKDRRWAQYAYQFAHEFCHILARFDNKDVEHARLVAPHQWFEETLCELSSVYALRHMAIAWKSAPPVPEWLDYAPAFAQFAETVLSRQAHDEAAKEDLAGWYARHEQALADDPYQWQRNEVFACLLLPFFERNPGSWASVGYLNSERRAAKEPFIKYLQSWRRALPPGQRVIADEIIDAFRLGARPPLALAK
jgi:hypothetical protein